MLNNFSKDLVGQNKVTDLAVRSPEDPVNEDESDGDSEEKKNHTGAEVIVSQARTLQLYRTGSVSAIVSERESRISQVDEFDRRREIRGIIGCFMEEFFLV
jgi:hypothetical protein